MWNKEVPAQFRLNGWRLFPTQWKKRNNNSDLLMIQEKLEKMYIWCNVEKNKKKELRMGPTFKKRIQQYPVNNTYNMTIKCKFIKSNCWKTVRCRENVWNCNPSHLCNSNVNYNCMVKLLSKTLNRLNYYLCKNLNSI